MKKDYSVLIYNKIPDTKTNGVIIPGEYGFVKNSDADMQPYSTKQAAKEYGFDINVNKRLFMDFDDVIVKGTLLHYTNKQNKIEKYKVEEIIAWEDYIEILCNQIS